MDYDINLRSLCVYVSDCTYFIDYIKFFVCYLLQHFSTDFWNILRAGRTQSMIIRGSLWEFIGLVDQTALNSEIPRMQWSRMVGHLRVLNYSDLAFYARVTQKKFWRKKYVVKKNGRFYYSGLTFFTPTWRKNRVSWNLLYRKILA